MREKLNPNLQALYDCLEGFAIKGERCPTMPQLTKLGHSSGTPPSVLARMGYIMIDVYAHNWRVVTIMCGPNKGRHTEMPANKDWRPYKSIYGRVD